MRFKYFNAFTIINAFNPKTSDLCFSALRSKDVIKFCKNMSFTLSKAYNLSWLVKVKIPVLQRDNVKMKNPEQVLEKINNIISGKKQNLQIITDYDMTLTKQHVNGEGTHSSFSLLSVWDQLPPGFMNEDSQLKSKYYPIEIDLNMTPEEKTPYMVEWYSNSQKHWTGVKFNLEGLRNLIAEKKPELREGTVDLCKVLEENEIPVLVLSAGLGDVLTEVLRYHGLVENEYFHIISNFFKLKDGVVQGYGCRENGFFIHPFNKNGLGCSNYFKKVSVHRHNVILLGDSLGDAKMDEGVPEINTVLKIGFLYGRPNVDQGLSKFMENFDIVLVDDQTMDVLKEIINLVIKS